MAFNIVEFAADQDDSAFDQPCKFGHRVEGHAVYCHNDNWDDSPRKCRRTWYTGGTVTDESCTGFEPNPNFTGELVSIATPDNPCQKCLGKKRIATDRGKTETCPVCMGDGSEVPSLPLSGFQEDTLSCGLGHTGRNGTAGHPFIMIANTDEDHKSLSDLEKHGLIEIRSMHRGGDVAYLLENTLKGEAVLVKLWEERRNANPA